MCLQEGMSINIPAKIGKDKPVSATAVNCGVEGIAEIQKGG